MNEAIKLAIEKGGYDTSIAYRFEKTVGDADRFATQDPLFWQALGKALGWHSVCDENGHDSGKPIGTLCLERDICGGMMIQEWLYHAHQYIDLVLTGGDTEKFWKELLNA